MIRKEWSLIVNSIMMQLATGIFTCLAVYRLILEQQVGREAAMAITAPGMTFAGPVVLVGMIASLFHLGNPARAYRSVSNFSTSWLSREVFFTAAFFGLWLVHFIMEKSGHAHALMTWLTVATGVAGVISMAYIYFSTGKPGWGSRSTFADFFGTTLVLGILGSTIVLSTQNGAGEYSMKTLLIVSIVITLWVLLVRFVEQAKLIPTLNADSQEWSLDNLANAAPLALKSAGIYKALTLWGFVCSILGTCLVLFILIARDPGQGALVIMASSLVVFIGESLGRSGFYSLGAE